jgi:hypothetical protein
MPKKPRDTFSRKVNVVFKPERGSKCALFPDISDEEIFAIGRVTVCWALLEHTILDDCARMAAARRVAIPDGAFKVALKPRLRIWREMIMKYRRGKPKERLLKIVSRVANAQRSRNQITHGLWSWEYASPGRITAKSYKPNFGFTQSFDFQKLMNLGETLGEINFELTYPLGERQAIKELAERGFGMSRDFVRVMTGKGDLSAPPLSSEREKKLADILTKIESSPKRGE